MPVREQNFIRETLHLIQSIRDEWRTAPLVLGGSSGSGGGSSGMPGGVVGKLSQRHVSGDTTEASTLTSSGSITSLVSNLDRIRYWGLPSRQFGLEEVVPATNYWTVSSGSWFYSSGSQPLLYSGGNTPAVTPPVAGTRFDLLTVNTSGVLTWVQGDGAMPAIPSSTSGSLPLWLVAVRSSGSACHNTDQGAGSHYILQDARPWFDWGVGGAGGGGSLTASYVGFGSVSNTLTGSSNFTYSNGVLMVGGSSTPITAAGSVVSINNGTASGTVSIAYGASRTPVFAGYASHGALGSESASLLGDRLVALTGRGYGATGFAGASLGSIRLVAAENWGDDAQGTQWEFLTTGSGTDTPTIRGRILEDGTLSWLYATRILDTTDSSSVSTGALIVDGGVGIAKALTVGEKASIGNSPFSNVKLAIRGTLAGSSSNYGLYMGDLTITPQNNQSAYGGYFVPIADTGASNTLPNVYGLAVGLSKAGTGTITTAYGLHVAGITDGSTNYAIYTAGAGLVKVSDTTDSTSVSTGALIVSGGVGVAKQVTVGTLLGVGRAPTVSGAVIDAAISNAGAASVLAFTNTAAAGTGNQAGVQLRANTDSFERAALAMYANFTTTTDASRASQVIFQTQSGGAIATSLTIDASRNLVVAGGLTVSGTTTGVASSTSFTNATNTTVTNTYLVKGGQAANTVNTGWIKIFIGTNAAWIPYWTNATP